MTPRKSHTWKDRWLGVFLATTMIVLSGCATMGNWQPTIDARNDPNERRIYADLAECKQLAHDASGLNAREVGGSTLLGGAVGAAAGAALGAATGNAGRGAAIGAASGGLGYGIYKSLQGDEGFKQAYARCMEGRGHRVINN